MYARRCFVLSNERFPTASVDQLMESCNGSEAYIIFRWLLTLHNILYHQNSYSQILPLTLLFLPFIIMKPLQGVYLHIKYSFEKRSARDYFLAHGIQNLSPVIALQLLRGGARQQIKFVNSLILFKKRFLHNILLFYENVSLLIFVRGKIKIEKHDCLEASLSETRVTWCCWCCFAWLFYNVKLQWFSITYTSCTMPQWKMTVSRRLFYGKSQREKVDWNITRK
jgi:hypothetical protein